MPRDYVAHLRTHGFGIVSPFLTEAEVATAITECESLFAQHGRRPAGVRGVLSKSEFMSELAAHPDVHAIIAADLGPNAFVTRSILFDKSPDANWDVPWHQDTTIAVEERVDVVGFGPWSVKNGVPHVRPPAAVLDRMLTVRIHFDACGETNGPLLVDPGSHRRGMLGDAADWEACEARKVACVVDRGGAVLMRPLTMHASRKAVEPSHRRVLHLEFAAEPLSGGLRWARN